MFVAPRKRGWALGCRGDIPSPLQRLANHDPPGAAGGPEDGYLHLTHRSDEKGWASEKASRLVVRFFRLSRLPRVEPPCEKGRHERHHQVDHRRHDYRRDHQRPDAERQLLQGFAEEEEHGGYQRVDRQPGDRDQLVAGWRRGVPAWGQHEPPLKARDDVSLGWAFLKRLHPPAPVPPLLGVLPALEIAQALELEDDVVLAVRRVARLKDLGAQVTGEARDGVGDARNPLFEFPYSLGPDAACDVHRHGRVFDVRTTLSHGCSITSHLVP